MKTIVAPVDFSDASANAVSFAAELAKRSSARLIIVNTMDDGQDEQEVNSKLKSIESGVSTFFGPQLSCETLVARGTLTTVVEEMVRAQKPDLVVMGTKGASGLKRVLIGSNTVNVISKTRVPVLVIPEVAKFDSFLKKGKNRIVLATDLEELEDDKSLDILKEIALLIIEPKVRVLSVRPKNTNLDHLKRLERDALLSAFKPEIESERVTVFSGHVLSGINFYLNKNEDTGLIAMIARDSGALIQKHYTREMASHTQFPLLVLHDA